MQTPNEQTLRADETDKNQGVLPPVLSSERRPNAAVDLLVAKVEALTQRMFRHRISQAQYEKWQKSDLRKMEIPPRSALRRRIEELVLADHVVTTGWMPTSIRGWHEYWIIWRKRSPRKTTTSRPAA